MGPRVITIDILIAQLKLHRKGINEDLLRYHQQVSKRGMSRNEHNKDVMYQMANLVNTLTENIKDLKETQGFQHYTNSNHDNNIQSKDKHPSAPPLRP